MEFKRVRLQGVPFFCPNFDAADTHRQQPAIARVRRADTVLHSSRPGCGFQSCREPRRSSTHFMVTRQLTDLGKPIVWVHLCNREVAPRGRGIIHLDHAPSAAAIIVCI